MADRRPPGSAVSAGVQAAVAALAGLVALPALLGGGIFAPALPSTGTEGTRLAWLICAVAASVWLIATGPPLAIALASSVDRVFALGGQIGALPRQAPAAGAFAGGFVAILWVLLAQATIRRPLIAFLGAYVAPASVEAVFATLVLVLLLVLLYLFYRAARPLVETAAWSALDAVIATSGSEGRTATQGQGTERTRQAGIEPATVGAPRRDGEPVPARAGATVAAPRSEGATLPASAAGAGGVQSTPAEGATAAAGPAEAPTIARAGAVGRSASAYPGAGLTIPVIASAPAGQAAPDRAVPDQGATIAAGSAPSPAASADRVAAAGATARGSRSADAATDATLSQTTAEEIDVASASEDATLAPTPHSATPAPEPAGARPAPADDSTPASSDATQDEADRTRPGGG